MITLKTRKQRMFPNNSLNKIALNLNNIGCGNNNGDLIISAEKEDRLIFSKKIFKNRTDFDKNNSF